MPITPAQARAAHERTIPPEVFAAFDALIAEGLDSGGVAVVPQKAVVARILARVPPLADTPK